MEHEHARHATRTYAGVLGKIIGVYLGRPVEGWSVERIASRFGSVRDYVHAAVGAPLIVADDDISGTFAFFRSLAESGYANPLTSANVANTWLNQIVPERTILWWGGLGRSTEHTAWLRLRAGVPAPQSGSIALNGRTAAEQIGAQIFMDAFALACPGDPERATALVRAAASVSHDGLAVEAAAFLAALEALAFVEQDLERLFDAALPLVRDARLLRLVEDVRAICAGEQEWRRARARIEETHGYWRYGGNCPIGTNHAAVLMALLLGGNDFGRALEIAVSAGWDTDCNAGNVGCVNGIRLGLDAIPARLRGPVADRLLVVSAEGGECVSDAVRETRRILHASAMLRGASPEPTHARFAFEFPGARQGWEPCPSVPAEQNGVRLLEEAVAGAGLLIEVNGRGATSTPTWLDLEESTGAYSTLASPTLYATQTVAAQVRLESGASAHLRLYVLAYDPENRLVQHTSEDRLLTPGDSTLHWRLPEMAGLTAARLGLELWPASAETCRLRLLNVDWCGAPAAFVLPAELARTPGAPQPAWLRAWVPSARHFAGDSAYTFVVSHPEANGVVTTGTRDWADYTVSSRLTFSLHKSGGLVARSQGHRRYLAALLSGGNMASIVRMWDGAATVLASTPFAYVEERPYAMALGVDGEQVTLEIDGVRLLKADDRMLVCGGAGFVVDSGTLLASGFAVHATRR